MTVAQLPLALIQHHANRQLFADHYLNAILPRATAWLALYDEAAPVLAHLRTIFAAFSPAPSINEAQTEHALVRPVLEALGHAFALQVPLKTPAGTKKPDYLFVRDPLALKALPPHPLSDADCSVAFAVGEAKAWERKLDVAGLNEPDTLSRVPARQIAFYMLHSGVPWGFLTNGRRWRLYHQATARKEDVFYEVDLQALVEAHEVGAFLYFYAFFRRAAFDPPTDGTLTLDALLRESVDYARALSTSLKAQVFDALRHLAQGFLDYPPNQLAPTPATLHAIYAHSLTTLYRLLFVLYAEARELLPCRESAAYREQYSLYTIVRDAAKRLDSGVTLLINTGQTWARLRDLFGLIDQGSEPLRVATFNGGLFDPQRHPFLVQHSVGDAQLQRALDQLARIVNPQTGLREYIDYRDLAERHLGTIYEGLLEYHLQACPPTPDGFTIELVNAKGERHRTGSYYTPDFVVQYIVEQTLRPVLEAAVAGQTTDAAKVAAVLAVNCLDPAMGSGHFLVAAMEYIARFLVELGIPPSTEAHDEADLAVWKRRVTQSCLYGVDLNPLAVDLAKLSLWLATAAKARPLSFLDHHLRCGNALVGTRITDLDTQPLSATRRPRRPQPTASNAQASVVQISLLDDAAFAGAMQTAVASMWLIEGSAGRTVADVKAQEQQYEQVRHALTERFAIQADLHTAAGFGQAPERNLWQALVAYATKAAAADSFAMPAYDPLLQQVQALAGQQRFFHWDLEFPEVFYDRYGRPLGEKAGFDAVIGNPPYVRQEQLGPLKPYFQAQYAATYHGAADLYIYFYQQGLRLLRDGGRLSYIVTNKWLRAGYGEGVRGFFAEQTAIERIVDFGHAPIFAGADVFPVIIVVEKPSAATDLRERQVHVTNFPREALKLVSLESYVARYNYTVPQRRLGRAAWSLESANVDDLMMKIRRAGVPLVEYAGVKPYYGIKTGLNEAFLIDTPTKERLVREDARSADIIKPYLRGQDIKRWSPEWANLWMIFTGHGVAIEQYPGIEHHLTQYRDALEQRAGTQAWWQFQSTGTFHHLYAQPKIVWKDLSFHSEFCLDESGLYTNDLCFILPVRDLWLITVLNSPLMWAYMWRNVIHGKDEVLRLKNIYTEVLPIAPATDEVLAEIEPAVAQLIAITQAEQAARRDMLDWLRTEFAVEQAGQQLSAFAELSADAFVEAVRKRRPRSAGKLTPAGLKALRAGYLEQATPVQQQRSAASAIERRLSDLVNTAYGLSPADCELLWRSAPPRMPVGE